MNKVLVVESGAKTKTIRGFLGGEFDVVASGGHIVDLPDDELAVDTDDFTYTVEPIARRGGDAVESMQEKLVDADVVYLATDPDREGEAIAADIRDHAVPEDCAVHRIEFNAIVYPAVKDAIENPRSVDEDQVQAQRARRSLDRLIGFILSSITKFDPEGPGTPSVGRVQSPAIRLVTDRESEIESFDVRRYWTIHGLLTVDDESFEAHVSGEWDAFDKAKSVVDDLTAAGHVTITDCDVDTESEQHPLPPYTTDALQNDADFLLNYSPERTMELAQDLYEGMSITTGDDDGEGDQRALITYMRTDSTRVSPSALNLAKETLTKRDDLGEDLYRGRTWEPSGAEQDAHEAIRPTHPEDPEVWPEALEGVIDDAHLALYRIIYWRFLASQMAPAVYRQTTLGIEVAEYEATAVGDELLAPGFLQVWQRVRPEHGREEVDIPETDPGTELPLERAWPEPEETTPPPRYRQGSLVSELKERGIGRPSTYGDILTKIQRVPGGYGYVRKAGNTLQPTERGERLVEYLDTHYPNVVDYEYTRRMEQDLDRIAAGELTYREYLEEEFTWLREPYEWAQENEWMGSDKPTRAQIEFLKDLAERTGTDVPESVYESKDQVSTWIDKLQDELVPTIRVTDIYEAEAGDVEVHRFRVYYTDTLPDELRTAFSDRGLKYQAGSSDHPPAYQYQRTDFDVVTECREAVLTLIEDAVLPEDMVVNVGGGPERA